MRHELGPDTLVRNGCILIADLAGFTRKVLHHGTAAGLADVWLMRRTLVPLFRQLGGEVFKVDADNLYAFYPAVEPALRAAVEAHRELERSAESERIRVSVGIGFGELFYITSEDDYYGAEVNLASKLGEDIAEGGETLLTEAAAAALHEPLPGKLGRLRVTTVSDVRVKFRQWFPS
jgi:adenylate cyclase